MADNAALKHERGVNEPPTAGLIIIGDEILKGHTKDTNSYFLLSRLWSLGVKVKAVSVVSDDVDEIASHVRDFSSRFTHVLTSGGIGPTHDDVTLMAVGRGFDEQLVHNEQLAEVIAKVYEVEHLNSFHLKMAQIPSSTKLSYGIDKETKRPCSFPLISVHNVHIFPGVPSLLRKLFDNFSHVFSSRTMQFYLHRIYLSAEESTIAAQLQEVHDIYGDKVDLGSYPEFNCADFVTKLTLESLFPDTLATALDHLVSILPSDIIVRRETCTSGDTKSPINGMINNTSHSPNFCWFYTSTDFSLFIIKGILGHFIFIFTSPIFQKTHTIMIIYVLDPIYLGWV